MVKRSKVASPSTGKQMMRNANKVASRVLKQQSAWAKRVGKI